MGPPAPRGSGYFEFPIALLGLAYPAVYYSEADKWRRLLDSDLRFDEARASAFVALWNEAMPSPVTLGEIEDFYHSGMVKARYEEMRILYQPPSHPADPDPRILDRKKQAQMSQLERRDRLARIYACFWEFTARRRLEDWVLVFGSLFEIARSGDILPPWDDDIDIFISAENLAEVVRGFSDEYPEYLTNYDANMRNKVRARIIDRANGIFVDFLCYDTCGEDGALFERAGRHYVFARSEIYPRQLRPWVYRGRRLSLAIPAAGHGLHIGARADHPSQTHGRQVDLWPSLEFPPYTRISALAYYYFNFLTKAG
jgi:uncharacterized protein YciU (UPF0263 family)